MSGRTLRETLAEFYLSVAQAFPDLEEGTFATLQRLSKRRAARADRAYDRTTPPPDFNYRIVSIRILELFTIDSISELEKALLSTFPGLNDPAGLANFSDQMGSRTTTLLGTSWQNIGTIVRTGTSGFFGRNTVIMDSLPSEVVFVRVGLKQALPSFFTLSLDAHLTQEVTDRMTLIRESRPQPRMRFQQLVPHGDNAIAHSSSTGENEISRRLRDYLDRIRLRTLDELSDLVQAGFFASNRQGGPFIESFILDGLPDNQEELSDWSRENYGWLNAFDIRLFGDDYFINPIYVFSLGDRRRRGRQIPSRLFVRKQPFLDASEIDQEKIPRGLLMTRREDFFSYVDGALVVRDYLRVSEVRTGEQRQLASQLQMFSSLWPWHFRRVFRLHSSIVNMSSVFERLRLEYEQLKELLMSGVKSAGDFRNPYLQANGLAATLEQSLADAIDYQIDAIGQHITVTSNSFSRYLSLVSTAAIYWFTLIATVIAAIGLLGTPMIGGAIDGMIDWFSSLVS